LGGIIIPIGGGMTHFGVGIVGTEDLTGLFQEFNRHNLQDTKEDNQLGQDQVDYNKMNLQYTREELHLLKFREIVNLPVRIICIHNELNQVEFKIILQVG
jgi:hypothetical protein